jgi:hypothetical protein
MRTLTEGCGHDQARFSALTPSVSQWFPTIRTRVLHEFDNPHKNSYNKNRGQASALGYYEHHGA